MATNPKPDLSNLAACTEDARRASLDTTAGPADPVHYHGLIGRLQASQAKLPPLYRDAVLSPFLAKLQRIGEDGFANVLLRDPQREGAAGLMLDTAQAVLQNDEGYKPLATDAFQEVISDLYDGFLSAEDRRGVKPPDRSVIPPLVKWGDPDAGPYTWPADSTAQLGLKTGVVSLPPANAKAGLTAWAALGHETGGHDILGADTGLTAELARTVLDALSSDAKTKSLAQYWSSRIDETASDVMGILNIGPAAGMGLIAFFRGMNAAFDGGATLRNDGPRSDEHPADILRGYLAAETVRRLSFSGAKAWADAITLETDRDLKVIRIEGKTVTKDVARRSAAIVAGAIATTRMRTLEHHALIEIQDWAQEDEEIAAALRASLKGAKAPADKLTKGVYAAHVVAAAVIQAFAAGSNLKSLFERMLSILKTMHDSNPAWGPFFIAHRGAFDRHLAYQPARGRAST